MPEHRDIRACIHCLGCRFRWISPVLLVGRKLILKFEGVSIQRLNILLPDLGVAIPEVMGSQLSSFTVLVCNVSYSIW